MKIEINIKPSGKIVCLVNSGNGDRYDIFMDYRDIIRDILKNATTIDISNGTIYCSDGNSAVQINNYDNNKNEVLGRIINDIKRKFVELKKEKYRGRKVERVNPVIPIVIILDVILALSLFPDKQTYNPNDYVNTTIVETARTLDREREGLTPSEQEMADALKKTYEYRERINDSQEGKISDTLKEDMPYTESHEPVVINQTPENIRVDNSQVYNINYEDRTGTDKYLNSKATYYDLIEKISNRYGISPKIMNGIGTQEQVDHTINTNGPAIGKFQLEKAVWNGKTIKAFNYETNSYETEHITVDKLKDLEYNIKIACMYFQNCLDYSRGNIEVAIQMYNFGYGNVENTFRIYYNNPKMSLGKALDNYDENWLSARKILSANTGQGDPNYLENVMSYIEEPRDLICKGSDGKAYCASFNNVLNKTNSTKI